MKPFIRVFEPGGSEEDYRVVLLARRPEVHTAATRGAAERLAAGLARRHRCGWKDAAAAAELPQWWTADGRLRQVSQIELVRLGDGRFRYDVWSDDVRLSSELIRSGDVERVLDDVRLLLEDDA